LIRWNLNDGAAGGGLQAAGAPCPAPAAS